MSEPQPRHLKSSIEQGILVLTITETQLQNEAQTETLLHEMLAAVSSLRVPKLVSNFQHIKYISSVAFRPLLHLRRKVQEAAGRMVLCGLTPVVGDVFYTTRLVSPDGSFAAPFEMEPDVASAIARLKSDKAQT
jgi:anti-anti-sigma factor